MSASSDLANLLLAGPPAAQPAVVGAFMSAWDPATYDCTVQVGGAVTYYNLAALNPGLLSVGPVLLAQTAGGPIILGRLFQSVTAGGSGPVDGPPPDTTPGGGGTPTTGALSAGPDFSRAHTLPVTITPTVPAGSGGYVWVIRSGPMGAGTTIGTTVALSWTAGSSPVDTVDIRQPVCMEMALEMCSTAENSRLDWYSTDVYGYIEDIGDDRGYTGGIVGFCSGTGDMLAMVTQFVREDPSSPLADFLDGLEACADEGFGSGASDAAEEYLGDDFIDAWESEAVSNPIFRKVQRDFRKSMYWDDALAQALADGVGPLGLAIFYDVLVNHGVGSDSESFGGILAAARGSSSKPPSKGGSEAAYLTKVCDLRDAVLKDWGDYQSDGRSAAHRSLIAAGKFSLLGTVSWSMYGEPFSFNRPTPPPDAVIGDYVIRLSATTAGATTYDEVKVTVT